MKEIKGRMVYDSIEEIVDPKHTALLVIDIQNDLGPKGFLARNGRDIGWVLNILPTVKRVLAEARRRRMLIVFASYAISKDGTAESSPQLRFMRKIAHIKGAENYVVEGTWGCDVLEDLERGPNEPWIVKYRSSALLGTRLDFILKNSKIETAVVTGLVTEGCVESTVRDLQDYGYYPVILRDCVTSSRRDLHDAALLVMSARYDVITSDELLKVFELKPEPWR